MVNYKMSVNDIIRPAFISNFQKGKKYSIWYKVPGKYKGYYYKLIKATVVSHGYKALKIKPLDKCVKKYGKEHCYSVPIKSIPYINIQYFLELEK